MGFFFFFPLCVWFVFVCFFFKPYERELVNWIDQCDHRLLYTADDTVVNKNNDPVNSNVNYK